MSNLVKLLEEHKPLTARANTKGIDTTPIGDDNPRGEFTPSSDLARNEQRLTKGRRGVLGGGHPNGVVGYTNVAKYTDVTTRS
jgi:hypothetical protein